MEFEEVVADAQGKGGIVTTGGFKNTCPDGLGRFFEPTIIADANMGMRLMMDQTFGPIIGIHAVDSPGEAAKIMNS